MELLIAGTEQEVLRREFGLAAALEQPGLRVLGRLPQQEMLKHVRSSLCVFYPQSVHPETFGLIFAEANAVGTPVLAHDFGSAGEVLGGGEQLVDATDAAAVADKVAAWRDGGRPQVRAQPQFRASAVVAEWRRLLEGA
jgi:glycosyltransferase involved in cell wall biosynthesis